MKMIPCLCNHCGASVEIPNHYLSRQVRCTACLKEFIAKIIPAAIPIDDSATASQTAGRDEPKEASPEPEHIAPKTKRRPRVFPLLLRGFACLIVCGTAIFAFYEYQQRLVLERRLAKTEKVLLAGTELEEAQRGHREALAKLAEDLTQLDDTLVVTTSENKRQGSSMLRAEYSVQYIQKVIVRQQEDFGQMSLRVAMLEREVADKDKQASAALDLAIKGRKEAEEKAKPIRVRIKDLERQKEKLFDQYRGASTASFPTGVTSTRRAAAMMKDWESRRAPLLRQMETEMEGVRRSIEEEEDKLDVLFRGPK